MLGRLERLYVSGKLTAAGLANAVTKGWITETQKQEIPSEKQWCQVVSLLVVWKEETTL